MPFDATSWPAERGPRQNWSARRAWTAFALLASAFCLSAALAGLSPSPAPGDPELARLMRAMAGIKSLLMAAALAAAAWRFGAPAGLVCKGLYAGASISAGVGVGLAWQLSHPAASAVLTHLGLIGAVVLLLRDKGLADLLKAKAEQVRRCD